MIGFKLLLRTSTQGGTAQLFTGIVCFIHFTSAYIFAHILKAIPPIAWADTLTHNEEGRQ